MLFNIKTHIGCPVADCLSGVSLCDWMVVNNCGPGASTSQLVVICGSEQVSSNSSSSLVI